MRVGNRGGLLSRALHVHMGRRRIEQELHRLEEYFSKLMAEREAALAEERKKAEERARQQAQMATLSKAATMLQKIWRGKQLRRAIEGKKAGKGGKGGKKGKKGK